MASAKINRIALLTFSAVWQFSTASYISLSTCYFQRVINVVRSFSFSGSGRGSHARYLSSRIFFLDWTERFLWSCILTFLSVKNGSYSVNLTSSSSLLFFSSAALLSSSAFLLASYSALILASSASNFYCASSAATLSSSFSLAVNFFLPPILCFDMYQLFKL